MAKKLLQINAGLSILYSDGSEDNYISSDEWGRDNPDDAVELFKPYNLNKQVFTMEIAIKIISDLDMTLKEGIERDDF